METPNMFNSLSRLFASLNALAQSVQDLSGTVREMDASLRQRLTMDAPADDAPAIEHQPAENGAGRRGKKQPA
jgi:hypothetical protein